MYARRVVPTPGVKFGKSLCNGRFSLAQFYDVTIGDGAITILTWSLVSAFRNVVQAEQPAELD